MTLATTQPSPDLNTFFEELHTCRDKNVFTHGVHPYPAKFIPHIPRALIRAYAEPGALVCDPMCGSGTTLVEAAIAGCHSIGVDSNPIAILATRAKTTRINKDDASELSSLAMNLTRFAQRVESPDSVRILDRAFETLPDFPNRMKWFHRHVLAELAHIRTQIEHVTSPNAKTLALCAYSAIVVPVSNQESETRWCAKPKTVPPGQACVKYSTKLGDTLRRSLEFGDRHAGGMSETALADARQLPVGDQTIDFVVTSPPYANAHDYYLYNKLRLFLLGYDVRVVQEREIGSRNKHSDLSQEFDTYAASMGSVVSEIIRILRPGGAAAIVVADAIVRGRLYPADAAFATLAQAVGFSIEGHFCFSHKRFNSSFQRGFGSDQQKQTHVLVLRK